MTIISNNKISAFTVLPFITSVCVMLASCGDAEITPAEQQQLGETYYYGHGVQRDFDTALKYFKAGCDSGLGESCYFAGKIALQGTNQQKSSPQDALHYFTESCTFADIKGCLEKGKLLDVDSPLRKPNLTNAKNAYIKACKANLEEACMKLAIIDINDKSKEVNFNEGIPNLTKACNVNFSEACGYLAYFTFQGYGVERDESKAYALAQPICSAHNDPNACAVFSYLMVYGRNFDHDVNVAYDLAEATCHNKQSLGCLTVAKMLDDGSLGERNVDKAQSFYQLACQYGETAYCDYTVAPEYVPEPVVEEPPATEENVAEDTAPATDDQNNTENTENTNAENSTVQKQEESNASDEDIEANTTDSENEQPPAEESPADDNE